MPSDESLTMEGIRSVSHLSTRVMERLLVEIPEAKIVSGIKEMLNASYVTKSGKEHPDYRAREAGVRLYLAYTVGLPLQRQVVSSVTPPQSGEETMERLMASPATRRALKQVLDDTEA